MPIINLQVQEIVPSRFWLLKGKTGYSSAYHEILQRGARVIELDEIENKIQTYIRTLAGIEFEYLFTLK